MLDSEIKVKQAAVHPAAELAEHVRGRHTKTERGYLIGSQAGIYALYPHGGAVRYCDKSTHLCVCGFIGQRENGFQQ